MQRISQYAYYMIIGVVSLIMLVFIPMFGSELGLEWELPNTTPGWIAWISAKLSGALLNILLLRCFDAQGKLNASKREEYKQAAAKLSNERNVAKFKPRSPKEYSRGVYGRKGLTLFVGTILGSIGLGQAILVYDVGQFIIQAIALVIGLIAGVFQMFATEEYYTGEFIAYVNRVTRGEDKDV